MEPTPQTPGSKGPQPSTDAPPLRRSGAARSTPDDCDPVQLKVLAADIAARLRRVCGHLPEDEFSALVLGIARVTLRYEQRALSTPVVLRAKAPPRDD